MSFKELVSPSLTDLFVKELETMIISGELKIGEQLPTERELAKKMKVSLAVVNGGMKKLENKGFIRIAPRKGIFIADYARDGNINTLEAILQYMGGHFTPDILKDILYFREGVEGMVAQAACVNRTDEQLTDIRIILENMKTEKDLDALSELAYRFYHTMAIASGNIVFPLIASEFHIIYTTHYRAIFSSVAKEGVIALMENVVAVVTERDAQAALKCATENIQYSLVVLEKHYRSGQEI